MWLGNASTITSSDLMEFSLRTTEIVPPADPTTAKSVISAEQRLLIGVLLAISGNLLISVALNIQKYSHIQLADSGESYLKSPIWWCGLILMCLGEVGNFSAYGFAAASLVAPLGTTTVITNAFIAFFIMKEKIRHRDMLGVVLCIVGAFLLVNFSTKSDTTANAHEVIIYLKQWPFLLFVILEMAVFIFVIYLHYAYDFAKVVTILLQVAILGSLTVISAKAVSSMLALSIEGHNQMIYPIFYIMLFVMLATAVGQIKFLNQAMALYDSSVVVPTNFVFFTMFAILSGIVFYQEFYGLVFLEIFMFLFGAILSFVGVYLITGGRKEADRNTTPEESKELLSSGAGILSMPSESVRQVQPSEGEQQPNRLTDVDDNLVLK